MRQRKAYYVKRDVCQRENGNSGPFIFPTKTTVTIGPFYRECFAEREAIDCMGHPNTVPYSTEIIEREVA